MVEDYHLQRFLEAQAPVYEAVVSELAAGQKRTHWMWFIFPQISGLGLSPTSVFYAISSLEEARAYLRQSVLGARLRECAGLALGAAPKTAVEIFGHIDAAKFRSSMTLFAAAEPGEPVFGACLTAFFSGEADPETLARI